MGSRRAPPLFELEVAHVALAELNVDACLGHGGLAEVQHWRRVDPEDGLPVSRATGIATRPFPTASSTIGPSAARELDEGDVLGHRRRPLVVDRGHAS